MAARSAAHDGADVMIEVENLTKYYGPSPALRDVSLTARRGEILGFLGPNGAGKTTAMRIITGFLPPTSGTVRVAGHDVLDDSLAARQAIGYMPETMPLYPEMTVAGYLTFLARLREVKSLGEALDRVMDRVAITDHADQLIGHLSKGYRQRVGIAQALIHDPDVIILDEPTIGLDPRQIREVRRLIRELGGDHTVVLSTHILPEAQQVCDRVLIINNGVIVAEDMPEELGRRLAGGEQVRVVVDAAIDGNKVAQALRGVPGVREVTAAGGNTFHVMTEPEARTRAEIAKAVVEHDWPLLELRPSGLTLEDIFLQLTAEDAAEGRESEAEEVANA